MKLEFEHLQPDSPVLALMITLVSKDSCVGSVDITEKYFTNQLILNALDLKSNALLQGSRMKMTHVGALASILVVFKSSFFKKKYQVYLK